MRCTPVVDLGRCVRFVDVRSTRFTLNALKMQHHQVPPGTKDHVFADIRAWYVEQKYKFFGVKVPASTEAAVDDEGSSVSDSSDADR